MPTESGFILSFNFTTVRGDTYEEFFENCTKVWGDEAEAVITGAYTTMRNHYLNEPTFTQATHNLQSGLGAQPVNSGGSNSGSGTTVALDVPFSDKDKVKQQGARWDKERRAWSVPAGHPLTQQYPLKAA